jgi:hypothetical protein
MGMLFDSEWWIDDETDNETTEGSGSFDEEAATHQR